MPILQLSTSLQLCYYINRGGQRVRDLDPSKKTVVFLHALCTNASAWDLQMADPRLNQLYNLVSFDGESQPHHFPDELLVSPDQASTRCFGSCVDDPSSSQMMVAWLSETTLLSDMIDP